MKKIIKIFVVLNILISTIYADISKEKLHNYLDVSVGGAMFLSYHFDTIVKFSKMGLNKKALKKMIDDEKYLNLYTSEFVKMNDSDYIGMMSFYNTDVGKKYTENIYNIAKIDKNEFKKLYEHKKCTSNQKRLIEKIEKNLDTLKLRMQFKKNTMHQINSVKPKYLRKSIYEIEILESEMGTEFIKNQEMISCLMYQDFSIPELKEIYKYASSDVGKHETKLIYDGFTRYFKVFISDIINIQE